jgi:tetratricopeptide (TPR) repeat protein
MIICSECGNTVEDTEQFCSECGTRVPTLSANQAQPIVAPQPPPVQTQPQQPAYVGASVASTPAFDIGGSSASQVSPASGQAISSIAPKLILGVAAVVIVLVVIVVIAMTAGGGSVEKKLDEAIAKKNLFGPSTDNAYNLYTQLKNSGANEQTLKPYGERLTPLLIESGFKLTKDLPAIGYDEPDTSVWQDAAKNLNWAAELNPGNNQIASRAVYCDGRAAFLQKQNDRALPLWTKAASLDKTWALPVNGMGLIYLDRKDYSNARSCFSDAINRDGSWPIPYANMANAYYQEKNRSSAKDFYNQALAKAPNWARPHTHLGDIAMEEGDYATAVAEFQKALDSNMVGLKGDDFRRTQDALERARKHLPSY